MYMPSEIFSNLARRQKPMRGLAATHWYIRFFIDPVACLRKTREHYGQVAAFGSPLPVGQRERLHLVALGPDLNQFVLGQPDLFRTTGQTVAGPLGSAHRRIRFGLTAMNGSLHQEQRRLVLPAFHAKAMERYHGTIVSISNAFLEQWREGQVFDLWAEMRVLALRISSTVLFGQTQPALVDTISSLINQWLTEGNSRSVRAFPVNCPGVPYRHMLKTAEQLERAVLMMIGEKRDTVEKDADLLATLIRGQRELDGRMTDAHLVGQATILFGASYETMVNALVWTFFLLAQHPSVTADLLDELTSTLHGSAPNNAQLSQLPLLEAVIKESLRILPPVPFTIRGVASPLEIKGIHLNKSDRVICSHYVTHHMAELFSDPERFLPYRWFGSSPGPYEYLPFSNGPRVCIGAGFAMTVMKVVLAVVLQRFRLSVVPESRIDRLVHVTMRPKSGMPIVLHRQDRRFHAVPVQGNIHEMVRLTESC
jgi:cytochrome P450